MLALAAGGRTRQRLGGHKPVHPRRWRGALIRRGRPRSALL